ncbi:DUF6044 family protein [Arenicellales bacterium IMCC56312]
MSGRRALMLAGIFGGIFYLPWLFSEFRVVWIADNLDGLIPTIYIASQVAFGIQDANLLLLNGAVPVHASAQLFKPLIVLYEFFPPWAAYGLTDLAVRIVAFSGIFLLAKKEIIPPAVGVLVGLVFATSISYSHFLLTISGIPLGTWAILSVTKTQPARRYALFGLVFFIGLNISLPLSGIFLMPVLPLILYIGFRHHFTPISLLAVFLLYAGIVVGNATLIYSFLFTDIVWHRELWPTPTPNLSNIGPQLLLTIKELVVENSWYHVSYGLSFLASCFLFATFSHRDGRTRPNLFFCLLILAYLTIFLFWSTDFAPLMKQVAPITGAIGFSRFFFLYSATLCIGTLFLLKALKNNLFAYHAFVVALSFQLLLNLGETQHLKEPLRRALDMQPKGLTFDAYYSEDQYRRIKNITKDRATLSVGLDPMVANMNNIPSIDGYWGLYPYDYKLKFREIIIESMEAAGAAEYFDDWGHRLYAFHPEKRPDLIDFCAAKRLGADYIIAKNTINDPRLEEVLNFDPEPMFLYDIVEESCSL